MNSGLTPGAETQLIPDEADVLDAGDVGEGLGVDGLATSTSTASGGVVVYAGGS